MTLLSDILVRQGKATADQIKHVVEEQAPTGASPQQLGQLLLDKGIITDGDLVEALADLYGCDCLLMVPDELLDATLVDDLPVEWARAHTMLPVRHEDTVKVLMADPAEIEGMDDIGLLLGTDPLPLLAPASEILAAVEKCYFQKEGTTQNFLDTLADTEPAPKTPETRSDDLLRVVDEAPVTQLVNLILLQALKARASDIHIEPFEKHLHVRYRVDGLLYEQTSPPKHLEASLVSRLKVMARLDIAEKRLPQDGMARVRVGEREIDIRISTIPVAEGERLVLRLLNRDSALLPLKELGMPDGVLGEFQRLLKEPQGVILVTGPTGSGKTTTLYAALRELDTRHMNVLTIEDPIEYQLSDIGQIQVKPKIGLTFAHGLRHILRQDPDVILVGEIRDLETAEICVRASLTGHLVFSTLHTNDAASAVIRMIDMGIEHYLLSSAIRASLAQRLVRSLCPKCRKAVKLTEADVVGTGEHAKELVGKQAWTAEGCSQCIGGYKGRTGIYELMTTDADTQEAIRTGIGLQDLRKLAASKGMTTILADGLSKVLAGETTLEEILRVAGTD